LTRPQRSNRSLVELVVADDPAALATMLMRLTDDSPDERDRDALAKFTDVTSYAALGHGWRAMF
jgi:hypothetical protein